MKSNFLPNRIELLISINSIHVEPICRELDSLPNLEKKRVKKKKKLLL